MLTNVRKIYVGSRYGSGSETNWKVGSGSGYGSYINNSGTGNTEKTVLLCLLVSCSGHSARPSLVGRCYPLPDQELALCLLPSNFTTEAKTPTNLLRFLFPVLKFDLSFIAPAFTWASLLNLQNLRRLSRQTGWSRIRQNDRVRNWPDPVPQYC